MQDIFPFKEYRIGQKEFIEVVKSALKTKKDVLANVPTGVGKTVSTLAPALKFAMDNKKTVIFLTSKHTHHKIAIDTLREIKLKSGIEFQVADFIGKRWMCPRQDIGSLNSREFREFCKHVIDNKECEFYMNYYSKERIFVNHLLVDELKNNILHVEELVERCRNAGVCSFEAAADLAKKSKVLIVDYFHVLNPSTRDIFFKKINKSLEDCILIWDEAHNIPSRARDLMSDTITTFSLDSCIRESSKYNPNLEESISKINNSLIALTKKLGLDKNEILVSKKDFLDFDEKIIEEIYKTAGKVIEVERRSFLGALANFLELWKTEDRRFSRILRRNFNQRGKPVISLSYNCLDPRIVLEPLLDGAHSNIFMSGTLYPLGMYEEIFGLKDPLKIEFDSPFPKENRMDLVVPAITTKFTERGPQMYEKIAYHINRLIDILKGNKIFFFPSYDILNKVKPDLEGTNILFEEQNMDKSSREAILNKFSSLKNEGATLFAVSSGSFGESIDLVGDKLNSVVIVGVPFAKNDLIIKEIMRYYDELFGKGLEYGYIIPAFTNVLQNAGRCIRSEKDKGIIIYLDERYAWSNYRKYFPKSINLRPAKSYEEIEEFLD